ncbi:MAG: carbon starvation protein A [Gemmatales bacterium]|nr:carbon starvation protein A [Gemmatales bacterium]MDW8385724.1 carbon starvation protein A [Gemmatales bacterium]
MTGALVLFAEILWTESGSRIMLQAMPLMLAVLLVLALAYRYYSAFLAARVAALNDAIPTPAHRFYDGQNYHPTNRWVLFGHHFAAISGAGPLIGPVLAIQYGYMPGLLWLLIGVCLAGAVQDMLVLAASVRRGGKSLAEIARSELGPFANIIVSAAILFIVVIALAGLGFVVVKALGGEEVRLAPGTRIALPDGAVLDPEGQEEGRLVYRVPEGCEIIYPNDLRSPRPESFRIACPVGKPMDLEARPVVLPEGTVVLVPGSSWGTFTIACTIPIALFVGLYMYKIRKGRVVEASLLGAVGVLAATVIGNWVPGSPLETFFALTKGQTVFALCAYGFVASVLPVWLLLCPRDYLSSFLKIGTIALLVVGTLIANPTLRCPPVNEVFAQGGPTFPWGGIFPFVFICIMCGAISGFHSLVASGTTPKMVDKESDIRPIGYGAMLIEGLVGVVALIAAASLPPQLYYDINIEQPRVADYQAKLDALYAQLGERDLEHLNLADIERSVGNETLRGRTGGAVTLAVGMSLILTKPLNQIGLPFEELMKYWYHFAIMFEALFILTTIDTGTRIARFLLQEAMGLIHPKLGQTDWLPGSVFATAVVTGGWGLLVYTGSIDTIWPMFGIANQLLAVVALALVTTLLINTGRGRYAPVTLLPMLFVTATTMTAGTQMLTQFVQLTTSGRWSPLKGWLNTGLTLFVISCVAMLLLMAASRWIGIWTGLIRPAPRPDPVAVGEAEGGAL